MKLIWGDLEDLGAGEYLLSAPRDTPDGIGSALAFGPQLTSHALRVEWTVQERWGGEEGWRGFWLYFPANEAQAHPAFYVRVGAQGLEWGWSLGPAPEQQTIGGTLREQFGVGPGVAFLSASEGALSLSVPTAEGIGAWHLPTCDLGFTRAMIWNPYGQLLAMHYPRPVSVDWPPVLGLYAEASVCRVKVG